MSTQPAAIPRVPFEKAAVTQTDRGKRVKQRDYLTEGRIPVIDQGQSQVGGYTNDEDFAFIGELPVVLFGDHTRAVKLVDRRFALGADGIKIFRPAEGVRAKYLYHWMKSVHLPDRGCGRHYQYLRRLSLPLPSPKQQDEIVAEIEKQFSRLDQAVANLKRAKANLKRYTAAVLGAAVGGGLVPTEAALARVQGRAYESGESLLRRISEARKGQREGKGKFSMPEGLSAAELPSLPDGWVWTTAMQACDVVVDCHNKTAPYVPAGIPLVRTTNIRDGRLLFEDMRYVDQPTYDFWSRRCPPKPGDVLFTREAPMGEAAVIPPGLKICLGQRTMLMRPSAALDKGFLLAALMSPVVRSLIDRVAVGSGVKHLRVGDVERIAVPLPPLAEQNRIVAELDRRLSIVREVEAVVDANLLRAQALRQEVLSRKFHARGEGDR